MKVLHVLTSNQRRGAETSAEDLCRELNARGHSAEMVALSDAGSSARLTIPVLGDGRRLSWPTLKALRRVARRADVVLAHGSSTLPACALALGLGGTPFVYANIGDPLYWADTRAKRLRVRLLLARAAKVAALSPTSAAVLQEVLGVPAAALTVITNGRDVRHFRVPSDEDRRKARADLDVKDGTPAVAFIGALTPEKRIDIAIDAVSRLDDAFLLVAGEGAEAAGALDRASRSLGERFRYLGEQADIRPVLAAADVLVLTSMSEGLPGVLIEASLMGVPAVATDVGFVRDIVIDGVTGVLVPAGDAGATAAAILTALRERPQMSAAARGHGERGFDLVRLVEAWESLLQAAGRRSHAQ